jgi:hypothetical protein
MIEALFLHEAADNRQPFVFWDGQRASPSFPKVLPKRPNPTSIYIDLVILVALHLRISGRNVASRDSAVTLGR